MLFFVVSFVISEEQRRTAKDVRFEKRQNLSWVRNILTNILTFPEGKIPELSTKKKIIPELSTKNNNPRIVNPELSTRAE